VIVGEVFENDFFNAWFKQGTDEDFFLRFPSGGDTFATGVNSGADVIGYESDGWVGWLAKNLEANEGTNDAIELAPRFVAVKYPNSQATTPFGVNNVRAVVGTYTDSAGKQHGFLANF
jgi:hypothetical protein